MAASARFCAVLLAAGCARGRAEQPAACAGGPASNYDGTTAAERWQRMLASQRGAAAASAAEPRRPAREPLPWEPAPMAAFIDTSARREPTWAEWLRDEPDMAARALFAVGVSTLALIVPLAAGVQLRAASAAKPHEGSEGPAAAPATADATSAGGAPVRGEERPPGVGSRAAEER